MQNRPQPIAYNTIKKLNVGNGALALALHFQTVTSESVLTCEIPFHSAKPNTCWSQSQATKPTGIHSNHFQIGVNYNSSYQFCSWHGRSTDSQRQLQQQQPRQQLKVLFNCRRFYQDSRKKKTNGSNNSSKIVKKSDEPVEIQELNNLETLAEGMQIPFEELEMILEELLDRPLQSGELVKGEDAIDAAIALEKPFICKYQAKTPTGKGKNVWKRDQEYEQLPRPPVIAIMGHVDHGKTTLLDTLRNANVAAKEAGGITQHIGAFTVTLPDKEVVTFIDTPGHAAFSSMRKNGAIATDIIVLVVAADDGVQPQTKEVLSYIKQYDIPYVIALNKIDSHQADIVKAKGSLITEGVELEEYGGNVQCIEISGKKGTNINGLLETLAVEGEMLELKARTSGPLEGFVLEARIEKSMGSVASLMVTKGTLRLGDVFVCDDHICRVKSMRDWQGRNVKQATPSQVVDVFGWRSLPDPGSSVTQVESEQQASKLVKMRERLIATRKINEIRGNLQKRQDRISNLDDITSQNYGKDGPKYLFVLVKGDVTGTVDALRLSLNKLKNSQCEVNLLRSSVGSITDSDIELAHDAKGVIVAFNVPVPRTIQKSMKDKGVELISSDVIYTVMDRIIEKLDKMMPEMEFSREIGNGIVKATFDLNVNKSATASVVAGSRCTEGMFMKTAQFQFQRKDPENPMGDWLTVYKGPAYSLRHLKDETDKITEGQDCGILCEGFVAMPNDKILCKEVEIKRPLFMEMCNKGLKI